jgi:hypothetical protein
MSIIAAGTTTTTALSSTGNTDGTLQFQVNGTTPSVTLNALGAVGVGASPNFGTSGQVLISGGSTAAPTWGTAGAATTATNLAGGSAGVVPYQTGSGATAFTAAGTTGQVLQSNGTAAPTWTTPAVTAPAGTTGQVQINNAGVFGAVGSGTTGQVLTSAGAGAPPTFATPATGAMVFLQEVVASNSAEVDLTAFSSTYDDYVVIFHNALNQTDDLLSLFCRFRVGGVWRTSNYKNFISVNRSSNSNFLGVASNGTDVGFITTGLYSLNSGGDYAYNSGSVTLNAVNTTGRFKSAIINSTFYNPSQSAYVSSFGHSTNDVNAGVLSGIRFLFLGANLTIGTFRLYGIKKN